MYIRESKSDEYQEYTDENNLFPVGYKLDLEQSGCVDSDGNEVKEEGIITQTEDNKITLKSTKTVYCYLYFEKSGFNGTGSDLVASHPDNLTTEPVADMYRFVGKQEESESINNYVCFGSTNNCVNKETDEHMYRIIGITTEGNIKIQKNKGLSSYSKWHTSNYNTAWPESYVYQTTLKQTFYEDVSLVTESMKNKIEENHIWKTGDVNGVSELQIGTGDTVYNLEKINQTHIGAVGLAYLSDYYFAYNEGGTQNCYSSPYCKSWMVPNNYDTLWVNQYEWTMTSFGKNGANSNEWAVYYDGKTNWIDPNSSYAVRPVFYLKSNVTLTTNGDSSDPEGSLKNPWIINE